MGVRNVCLPPQKAQLLNLLLDWFSIQSQQQRKWPNPEKTTRIISDFLSE